MDEENVRKIPAGADEPASPEETAPVPAESPADAESAEEAGPAPVPVEDDALLRDRWLRAEADLQNYRRRAAREREETRRAAEENVMLEVIGALDDLERALVAARDSGAPDSWVEGVRLVSSRLVESLARRGVTALDPVGEPFDPRFHEAVLEMDAPGAEPGHVTQVVLRGWRRGERALRAARVVVARGGAGDE